MKLWILRPIEGSPYWEPWYDKAFGFVVRAKDEKEARMIAYRDQGDEGGYNHVETDSPWLDSSQSTCKELSSDGESEMIIKDYAAA